MNNLIAGLAFSSVGFVAFRYGRGTQKLRATALGGVLMLYSWVTPTTAWTVAVGLGLTALLFVWRD